MVALSRENRLQIASIAGVAGAIAVIAAQFMDYTGFQLGTSGVESAIEVAPPPYIDGTTASAGSDQLWLGIPLGVGALFALGVAFRRRQWRLGRTVAAIGAVMLFGALVVLLPNATDGSAGAELGNLASAYEGVDEKLLGGFWVQLAGALAMIGSGLAMVRLRPAP